MQYYQVLVVVLPFRATVCTPYWFTMLCSNEGGCEQVPNPHHESPRVSSMMIHVLAIARHGGPVPLLTTDYTAPYTACPWLLCKKHFPRDTRRRNEKKRRKKKEINPFAATPGGRMAISNPEIITSRVDVGFLGGGGLPRERLRARIGKTWKQYTRHTRPR